METPDMSNRAEMKSKISLFVLSFLLALSLPIKALSQETPRPIFASSVYNGSGVLFIPISTPFANRACYFDNSSTAASSVTTATELTYVHGVSSPLQAQIDFISAHAIPTVIPNRVEVSPISGSDSICNGTLSCPYQTITHALSLITTASNTNRYVIHLMTGTTVEPSTVVWKNFVSLEGSGSMPIIPILNQPITFAGVSGANRISFSNVNLTAGLTLAMLSSSTGLITISDSQITLTQSGKAGFVTNLNNVQNFSSVLTLGTWHLTGSVGGIFSAFGGSTLEVAGSIMYGGASIALTGNSSLSLFASSPDGITITGTTDGSGTPTIFYDKQSLYNLASFNPITGSYNLVDLTTTINSITSSATITTENLAIVDDSLGVVNLNLPETNTFSGQGPTIFKNDSSSNNTNIKLVSGGLINGASQLVLSKQYQSAQVFSDGGLYKAIVSPFGVAPMSFNPATGAISIDTSSLQPAGNYITALTGGVSATGPGSVTATVNTVGGSTAANVHSAELLANAATNANTVSTIVKRDGSGNFSAGTITAALTGTASGNTTITPANHGVVVSGSANVLTVVGPDASTTKVLTSGGASADPSYQTLSTTNVTEGTNLYYTNGRVDTEFDTRLATKTTTNLAEGSNLYYTNGRVDTEFDTRLATKTTSNLAEGSNLYYTDARVQTVAKNQTSNLMFYVSKDAGNDANDCSRFKPCQTIQTGITAANAVAAYLKQAVVNVQPSNGTTSYNENLTLSQQGVILQCANSVTNSRACVVNGTLTVNLTGVSGGANFIAASNETYVNGFVFTSGASNTLTFSGTTFQRLISVNNYFQAGAASSLSATNSGITGGTKSTISAWDTTYENNSSSIPTISQTDGRVWTFGTQSAIMNGNASGHSVDQSGSSSFIANITTITGEINVTSNTANMTLNLSTVASGSNPCVVSPSSPSTGLITLSYWGCNSSATNSVTGSGVVVPVGSSARLGSSGDIISTVTQAVAPGFPVGEIQLGAGAVTGTNVMLSIKDGHIKATQTTVPTATVNANAGTSATCTLSNASDVAGKINLTTGTIGTPATGTQCTVNFNKAYGVAPICTISPANTTAGVNLVQAYVNTPTTAGLPIAFNVAGATSGTYNYMYHCVETQ